MKLFKKISLLALLAVLTSCGPSAYLLSVETRQGTASGVDLLGKTFSIVYMDNGRSLDSLFCANMASSFATKLEEDYFAGDSLINIYCLESEEDKEYTSKQAMLDLLIDTGSDVVFLFDNPEFSQSSIESAQESGSDPSVPFAIKIHIYDAMDQRDTVQTFSGKSSAIYSDLPSAATRAGSVSAQKFVPQWKAEDILFFIYSSQAWYDSYEYVQTYQWQKAMDIWISLLNTQDIQKQACIEYNMAAACYIQGAYDLASEWIDLSLSHYSMSAASSLKKKINSHK